VGGLSKVHRLWYPNAHPGQERREIKPVVKAFPILTPEGVTLEFMESPRAYTPDELSMLARWLFSLSHEAKEAASQGHITEEMGYNVETGESVPMRGR
jgi:hypothetical protein